MTLKDLLKQAPSPLNIEAKAAQAAKTAQLIAANKAAAAQILRNTLTKLEANKPVSRSVERQLWI